MRESRGSLPALLRSAEDPEAFREFYEAYAERVVVFLSRRTFDVEVASDLASETFAVALERRLQFRGRTQAEELGWLYAVARSQLALYWRRGRVERAALARIGVQSPTVTLEELERVEELAALADLRARIARAVGSLPEDQAAAVWQRIVLERSYEELASDFGVSEQVVRARVSRGLRGLAEAMQDPALAEAV